MTFQDRVTSASIKINWKATLYIKMQPKGIFLYVHVRELTKLYLHKHLPVHRMEQERGVWGQGYHVISAALEIIRNETGIEHFKALTQIVYFVTWMNIYLRTRQIKQI